MVFVGGTESALFGPADILLPRDADLVKWSVVACDQHTAEPEYWQRVDAFVGAAPSTLRMMLPEHLYASPELQTYIGQARSAMDRYLAEGVFKKLDNSYIYIERTLFSGKVRRGLMGQIDLECYSYESRSEAKIRTTEGIVPGRLPTRIQLREGARLEQTHVLLLLDDPKRTLIEPLASLTDEMETLYDFELMEHGGHIVGRRVGARGEAGIRKALQNLEDETFFKMRYGEDAGAVMVFATGDGNHSLATARACWEKLKPTLSEAERATHPARFALVELINIHDEALEFEPINRVLFDCVPEHVLDALLRRYGGERGAGEGHVIGVSYGGNAALITLPYEAAPLALGALETFLDQYIAEHGCRREFIHGDDVVLRLSEREGALGFTLPALDKKRFFPSIIRSGALPRKAFSMGTAFDKRYYLECRSLERS